MNSVNDKGRIFTDVNGIEWLIVQSYENGDYCYRAVNMTGFILSEATGKTLAQVIAEVESIEETIIKKKYNKTPSIERGLLRKEIAQCDAAIYYFVHNAGK